ncbi:aminopeptidase [Hippea maritima]|uniref:M18 family aminopeptidase n=1 Tax=Hippea maritima (strain ATCC 700847 / DSM 10411 / MH2) TaxID=760142 RepID=F2LU11_HIPMA|nr:aminopeptidase [Hippea maritima]AEA33410.1 peptidase M18 aminopeptidase I [Hippea maritima DSM 10411]
MDKKQIEKLKNKLEYKNGSGWKGESYKNEVFEFSEKYKEFIGCCKTERETVRFVGDEFKKRSKKSDFFMVNRGKNVALVRLGDKFGMKLVASHIDTPRIDLKQNPLFEDVGIAMFHTHYYGGIKKYQWFNIPLAIHGVVVKSDGEILEITVGEDDNDPVFIIPDLLPHLSHKIMNDKKVKDAFDAEKMNLIVGSIPLDDDEKDTVKLSVLKILNEKYGIVEEDFISAELSVVPSFKPKDVGFDKGLLAAYGHDDRICAFCSKEAFFKSQVNSKTIVALMIDKEEIGSDGNTGAKSRFLLDVVVEILKKQGIEPNFEHIGEFLKKSEVLSADVNGAVNPMYKEVHEKDNASYINHGVVLTKFTGHGGKYMANDAHAEFVGKIRRIFNNAGVNWQIGELGKVDEGGGGTIAKYLAAWNMDVVDCGPALISMHSPYEIASKSDLFETYKAYKAFFESD